MYEYDMQCAAEQTINTGETASIGFISSELSPLLPECHVPLEGSMVLTIKCHIGTPLDDWQLGYGRVCTL